MSTSDCSWEEQNMSRDKKDNILINYQTDESLYFSFKTVLNNEQYRRQQTEK